MTGVHLHLLISHVPIVGVLFGIALLAWGMIRRSNDVNTASLLLFIVIAVSGAAAFLSGEPAEATAENLAGVSKSTIERHEDSAKIAAISTYVLGAASLVGLIVIHRVKRSSPFVFGSALVLAFVAAGLLSWTGNLGGQIRYTEIGSPPQSTGSVTDRD
ncbi:hypothetical protein BH09PLA1_BH09PLA1_00110 [soil metagenome]